ncbi:MAG: serine/threonine-protein kinase, partial [Polyangiaceae bacterium]
MPDHEIAMEESLGDIVSAGDVVAGKYRVERVIGTGGMGVVVEAWHIHFEERVAIKFLFPQMGANEEALGRFEREARAAFKIKSEHVARVIDVGKLEGKAPYMVMEYLEGGDLADRLTDREPFVIEEAVDFVLQAVEAVAEAHALGIVHRDLKPENLFLTTRDDMTPCVKILDFGIAKLSGATGDLAKVKATATGDIFGTPMYMSPEQCKSEAEKISAQSDIWAFGLIVYRLLTGDDFWTANTLTHLIAQIAYEPMPKASERGSNLGPNFDRWFEVCCSRDVDERFKTASEAIDAFAETMGLDPVARVSAPMKATARAQAGPANRGSDPSVAPTPAAASPGSQTRQSLGFAPLSRARSP